MRCPYCNNAETKVVDKRPTPDSGSTRRRRECLTCNKRFTTYERVETISIIVIKSDGNREQFDRQKIEKGILRACEKRPVTYERIKKLIDSIESELRSKKNTEVKSSVIGNIIMRKLKSLDKIAYIRFASVYRQFEDIDSFKEELKKLEK
jgi:transcriptional repressor NrdR